MGQKTKFSLSASPTGVLIIKAAALGQPEETQACPFLQTALRRGNTRPKLINVRERQSPLLALFTEIPSAIVIRPNPQVSPVPEIVLNGVPVAAVRCDHDEMGRITQLSSVDGAVATTVAPESRPPHKSGSTASVARKAPPAPPPRAERPVAVNVTQNQKKIPHVTCRGKPQGIGDFLKGVRHGPTPTALYVQGSQSHCVEAVATGAAEYILRPTGNAELQLEGEPAPAVRVTLNPMSRRVITLTRATAVDFPTASAPV
ncbi:MAG: hypothetical protein U0136_14550 [Bdellovibrionota bacterium]